MMLFLAIEMRNREAYMQAVTSGANPVSIKKGIDKTCEFLVGKLRENAKPVKGTEDIKVRCIFRSVAVMCLPIQSRPTASTYELVSVANVVCGMQDAANICPATQQLRQNTIA